MRDLRPQVVGNAACPPGQPRESGALRLGLPYPSAVDEAVLQAGVVFVDRPEQSDRFTQLDNFAMQSCYRFGIDVARDYLETQVRSYAQTIAANAPLTVGSIKTIVDEVMKDESQRDMALCQQVVDRCFNSSDYVEGRTAFMEKRKPIFTGR